MKKILASDYDGTFHINDIDMENNIDKVKEFRKNGNIFIIATGNNYGGFIQVINKFNIEYDYLLLDDGAVIINNKNELIDTCYIDSKAIKNIYNTIKEEYNNIYLFNEYQALEKFEEKNITKISTRIEDLNKAKELTTKLNTLYGNYINAYTMIFEDINIVEMVSNKVDKNKALEKIITIEKVEKENVCVVGDGYNDIELIKNFDGYCMNNSVEELLAVCKKRTPSVATLLMEL